MNRLRAQMFKTNTADTTTIDTAGNNIPNANHSNGLLNKITKRYSTISSKITRRHYAGRKSASPQKVLSGSYDMTGANSEDHRLEIGAPILISTTTLDTDRFDVTEARLLQINGGIAATSTLLRTTTKTTTMTTATPAVTATAAASTAVTACDTPPQSSPQIPSSGSENEVFLDALSTPPITFEQFEDDSFELAVDTPKPGDVEIKEIMDASDNCTTELQTASCSHHSRDVVSTNPLVNYYETPKAVHNKPLLSKKPHSKSAQNLHRSELKVFLQRAPSVELNKQLTTADFANCHDLPVLPELYGSLDVTDNSEDCVAIQENSSPDVVVAATQSKSAPATPMCPPELLSDFLAQQDHFKSIDSLDIHRVDKRRSVGFSSDASINQHGSKHSLTSHNSTIEDFNLKSVSCQSLNAQSLFVSIDELNEITRQINESEDFNREIDLEYCTHRDNLKPSERRITLLKNKNTRLISFNNNKEKLKKSWNGVKHWLGEESIKIKEVVQKQSVLQRVSGSKMNLSNAECRKSPTLHGSVPIRKNGRAASHDNTLDQSNASSTNALDTSCDNLADDDSNEMDDCASSFTQKQNDEDSPVTKRAKREGQNGFEELRRYVKQGGDFGKELILILQERVDSELLYSKSLSKMANKLNKACRELPGSIAESWRGVATEMESRSDIHRQLSASLTDELVKPLKTIVESHHKTRKSVETNVDKAARTLAEWRVSEAKSKKNSHTAARENEKLQDAMLDVRIQKSPSIALLHQGPNKVAAEKEIKSAEKDCAKLDNKRKKAEEAVKRADVEYYTLCIRAERARVDWEMAVLRGSSLLQNIENQRLINMKNFVSNYTRLTADMNPILDVVVQRLQPQVEACNVVKDMQVVKNIRRNSEGPSEQLLPDFYCEHTTLAMNRERRKHALIKLLQLVKTDLERERRSRNGLKGLSQSLNNQEHQNIADKLYHIRSMLTYLEGARFKLHSALLELDHKPRTSHPLAQHIQITRDRTGLQQSILKVPLWLKTNDKMNVTNGEESLHENDSDCVSQANTSTNISCIDISASKDTLTTGGFNRSKSNIETFSTTTQITMRSANKTRNHIQDPWIDRGQADGGSNQQDSEFDEFSSQDDDDEPQQQQQQQQQKQTMEQKAIIKKGGMLCLANKTMIGNGITVVGLDCADNYYQNSAEMHEDSERADNNNDSNSSNDGKCATIVLSRCKALYSYTPKLYDELELNPGDIIEVHAKQEDGWWLGALGNLVGIFPATYVEEFA